MWEIMIKVIDESKKIIRLTAVRVPVNDELEFTHTLVGIIDTSQQRQDMLDDIKDAYLDFLDKQDRVDTFLAGLADTAVNSLTAWEATI